MPQVDGFKRTARLPTYGPEQDLALETAFAAAAVAAVTATPPANADKGAPPVASGNGSDKPAVVTGGSISGESVAGGDKGAAPPPPADAPDLTWLPEDVRSKVHFDDDETHARVKSGFMAHAAATAKFDDAAKLRKEAEAIERDAKNYRALIAHPKAGEIARAALEGREIPDPAAQPEADPNEPVTRAEAERIAATKAAAMKTDLVEEMQRPEKIRAAVNGAISAYAAENKVPEKVMTEAVQAANASLLKRGRVWETDPEQVATLLDGFVEAARVKYAAKPAAPATGQVVPPPNGHIGTEEVASPTGKGGPHTTNVVPVPSFYVNGQMPKRPLTAVEWEEQHLFRMRERFGPGVTLEQIRAANRA